ncbi:MAG: TraB/GumN family protein [Flavobacteriales bacterium]
MKKIIYLFCLLNTFSQAQLLYQISGKDLEQPSYLYGTIHILPKEQFVMSKSIERAFKTCSTLAMEVDLNMSASEKIAMAQRAVLADGKSLKDIMEPQDYIKLKMYCMDSLQWNESKFERSSRLQPMFFSSLLIQESMSNMASFEMEFNKMAKKQHKKTMGLETIDFQLSLFEKLPMSTQIGMLKEDYQSNMQNYDTLLALYLKEDLEGLGVLMLEETAQYPEFNELLLLARNRSWIAPMSSQMQKESTFFAVGAGHLAGPEGVIALLRKQGYTLTPIQKD